MVHDQRARGPDAQVVSEITGAGIFATLGHDRLSIIDLSAAANQPMVDGSGRFAIVFNGEIYNYRELRADLAAQGMVFGTASDTEVLLAAWRMWGTTCIERLNGMFAFAVFDLSDGTTWLVRDRFGVKPLYYHAAKAEVAFASTPRALRYAVADLRPNLAYVAAGLINGVYDTDGTEAPYEGVTAVPAGSVVEIRPISGRLELRCWRYYDLEERVEDLRATLAEGSLESLVDRVGSLLQDSVDLRLRSDVPVGISLSGGLDSSTIAALAAAGRSRLVAFSFGHPAEPASEGPAVASVAAKLGLQVTWISANRPGDLGEHFSAVVDAQDAPFSSASVVAQSLVFREARHAGVKVMLGGQGGDEVFMGYNKYRVFRVQDLVSAGHFVAAVAEAAAAWRSISGGLGLRGVRHQVHRYTNRQRLPAGWEAFPAPEPMRLGRAAAGALWRRQVIDVLRTSLPTLLRYEDRNSMGNSVESRLPFMDYRVVEAGIALPESLKLRGGATKWVLRRLMQNRLPERVRQGKIKRGFDTDAAGMRVSGLGEAVRSSLADVAPRLQAAFGASFRSAATTYSDRYLSDMPGAFAQAVSLVWLGRRL